MAFDVAIRTAKSDLHSGIWGRHGAQRRPWLPPAWRPASTTPTSRVTLPGFYKRVRELTDEEAPSLA